jgi:GNAT superfamily N-acetyltransferase
MALDAGTRAQMDALLLPLDPDRRQRLAAAMREVCSVLTPGQTDDDEVRLRGAAPGDLGWIIHRQALLYHQEYDWDWTYEGLISDIIGKFVAEYDPAREGAWIAELRGVIVGSVFLVRSDDPTIAKLRLLYVEPAARGRGIGRRLVDACIGCAREIGYRQLTLWTNDVLTSARRIYEAAGFRLTSEAPHHSFGHDLIGQIWNLDLE